MFELVLTAACLAAPQAQDPIAPRDAVREIRAALESTEVGAIAKTFERVAGVDDASVVSALAKGLRDERADVRWLAVRALRYQPNKKATSTLIDAARDDDVVGDPEVAAELFRAIGQRADKRALPLLADGLGAPRGESSDVIAARAEAIGRIRSVDSIETLVKFLRSGFAKQETVSGPACLSLAALTGYDAQQDTDESTKEPKAWVLWWNAERRAVYKKIPDDVQPAERIAAQWERMWRVPERDEMFDRSRAAASRGRREGGRGEGREGGRGEGREGARDGQGGERTGQGRDGAGRDGGRDGTGRDGAGRDGERDGGGRDRAGRDG